MKNLATPEIGSFWQHHRNGNIYRVLMIANQASTRLEEYPVMVVYQGSNGNVWTRKLDNWFPSFIPVSDISPEHFKTLLDAYRKSLYIDFNDLETPHQIHDLT